MSTENVKRSVESANTDTKSAKRVKIDTTVHTTQPGATEYVLVCCYVTDA